MTTPKKIGRLTRGSARLLGSPSDSAIHTDANGLVEGEVEIPVADGLLPAYRARPDAPGPHPILLVVQEVFGTGDYLHDICRRAAHAGFSAIAPELYARQGDAANAENREALFKIVLSVPDAQVMSDLDATAAWASEADTGDAARLVITGFCWGGRAVWLYAAHNPKLTAGVAWYGRLVGETSAENPLYPIDVAARLHAPVLGLYGGADEGIPLDNVEMMKSALSSAGDPSEFVVYPDAPHAFHADYRPSFVEAAARDGWARMLEWLERQGAR